MQHITKFPCSFQGANSQGIIYSVLEKKTSIKTIRTVILSQTKDPLTQANPVSSFAKA